MHYSWMQFSCLLCLHLYVYMSPACHCAWNICVCVCLLQEKTYSRANEVAKLEKLMKFVREPLLDKDKQPPQAGQRGQRQHFWYSILTKCMSCRALASSVIIHLYTYIRPLYTYQTTVLLYVYMEAQSCGHQRRYCASTWPRVSANGEMSEATYCMQQHMTHTCLWHALWLSCIRMYTYVRMYSRSLPFTQPLPASTD